MKKLTTEEFIKKAKEVHGDKYDYPKVNYTDIYAEVTIICPIHGEFLQRARQHLKGRGCPTCASRNKWNYETCFETAKRFKTRNDFKKKEVGAYTRALNQGWLNDYVWLAEPATGKTRWTKERCLEEAKKYQTLKEFQDQSNYAYTKAKKLNWLRDYTWFFDTKDKQIEWSREACYNEALKFNSRTIFRKKCSSAFNVAKKMGWLSDYTWFSLSKKPNGFWTREKCFEEAKKYKTRSEFQYGKGSSQAYRIARENGWIDDYVWFEERQKPNGYWTYERCFEEAQKYKTRTDFQKGECGTRPYKVACANGWLDDYVWFSQDYKPAGYWTYEKCREEAMKYEYMADFDHNSPSAYVIARKNDWIKEYDWLIKKKKHWTYQECYNLAKRHLTKIEFKQACPSAYKASCEYEWINDYSWFKVKKRIRYWTQERCYEEAKKYTSKKEFAQNSSAYSIACKNGWIADYDWLIDKRLDIIKDKIDCVYSYYFKETNTIYIGRTIDKKGRDYQHIFTIERDSVARYAKELGVPVPPMIILEDCLTLKEGQAKEDFWKKYYSDLGYNILNKGVTGVGRGSLGALGFGKWTKKACYEEAKNYTTKSAFKIANGAAYSAALKKGWLKDYIWFEKLKTPETYWTYNKCYEEAKKCNTLKEFYRGHEKAYRVAKKNGWIKDFTWFIKPTPTIKWTYEACLEKAKTCKSKVEFETKYSGAMNVARRNNWLKDYTWFERPTPKNLKWTYEACKAEASKYTSRGDFLKGSSTAYSKSSKKGWLDDFFPKNTKF